MEVLLCLVYFVLLCGVIQKTSFFEDAIIPRYWFILLFSLKIFVGMILIWTYTYYYKNLYTADLYKYFYDSEVIFSALKKAPLDYIKMLFAIDDQRFEATYYDEMKHWYRTYGSRNFSDSHVIIRFNAFVRLFSFGSVYVHNIFINFMSLIGLTALFNLFKPHFPKLKKLLFGVIFMIPSALFWGSGLLKESILFFSIGLFLFHANELLIRFKLLSIILVLITSTFIIYTKYYIILALGLPILANVLQKLLFKKSLLTSYLGALIIGATSILLLHNLGIINNPVEVLTNKQTDFMRFVKVMPTNSTVDIPRIYDVKSMLLNTPHALLNTFVRPFLWESNSFLMLIYSMENLAILFFITLCLFFAKKEVRITPLMWLCITFVLILFIITGLTVPVFGAIARYKVPGLPFLLIFAISLIDLDKLNKYPKIARFIVNR